MNIALVQTDLVWENSQENRKLLAHKIEKLEPNVDLIVLPEMFSTGFSMAPEKIAEPMEGETTAWMKNIAQRRNCAIVGSLCITQNGFFYNRLVFSYPDGTLITYDKRHLFTLAGEPKVYTKNTNAKTIISYRGWKICPLICYDLRFPVYARNVENYDVLLYVANWPSTRISAWDKLLVARAIENVAIVVGVNRVGTDENGNYYNGHSQVIDERGAYMVVPYEAEAIRVVRLDKEKLHTTRMQFPFLNDGDSFELL